MATTGNWNRLQKTTFTFCLYMMLEETLKAIHFFDYFDLGFFVLMIEKRNAFFKAIYHTLWPPLSPILIPLYWGISVKCFIQPDTWKPGLGFRRPAIVFTIVGTGVGLKWLREDCADSFGLGVNTEEVCTRSCAKTLFSVILMLAMMAGTWLGWNWDGGLMDLLFEWERRRFREKEEEQALGKVKTGERAEELVDTIER